MKKKKGLKVRLLKKIRKNVYAEEATLLKARGYLLISEEYQIPEVEIQKLFLTSISDVKIMLWEIRLAYAKALMDGARHRRQRKNKRLYL